MKLRANHRTCPSSRRLICRRVLEQGWTIADAAAAAGCSPRTAAKWLRRFRDGEEGLLDRSSRPHRTPTRLPQERVLAIEALRPRADDGGRDRGGVAAAPVDGLALAQPDPSGQTPSPAAPRTAHPLPA